MTDQTLFIALACAGLLSILIVYVTRPWGHHAHHGGLVYDAHQTTTAFHVHLHA